METRRLAQLDSLRGLASMMVVVSHGLKSTGLLRGTFRDYVLTSPFRSLDSGRPAVIFFFVLSGYVLVRSLMRLRNMSASTYGLWILHRLARLGLPTLASVLLSAALYRAAFNPSWTSAPSFLRLDIWSTPPTVESVLRQAALIGYERQFDLNPALWSLVQEVRASLLIPFAWFAVRYGRQGSVSVALLGVLAYGLTIGSANGPSLLGTTQAGALRSTVYMLMPFALGAAFALGTWESVRGGRFVCFLAVAASVALHGATNDLAGAIASILLIWAALQPGHFQALLKNDALIWLGRVSFSLYLVHMPLIAAACYLAGQNISPYAVLVLGIATSLLMSEVFYRTVERPSLLLAKRLFGGNSQGRSRTSADLQSGA